MIEIPLRCSHCGKESIVDISTLDTRPVTKVVNAEGYECSNCGIWEPVFYMTVSLKEKLARLDRTAVGHKKFNYLFGKALKKAENLRSRF